MKNKALKTLTCPKCGKDYHGNPALSRDNNILICPDCGTREALESINICAEEQEAIIDIIHRYEK